MRRVFCFLLVFFLSSASVLAQEYGFDVWTTANGLPQNTVTNLAQTPDGYLWLSTFDGLARFDGVRFTIFDKGNTKGIVNNRFAGVFVDKDGTLWAWTENGVLTIYRDGVFESFSTPEGLREKIANIAPDARGVPLIETYERYYYFQDGKLQPATQQKENRVRTFYYGRSGAEWIFERRGITQRGKNGQTFFYPLELNPEWLIAGNSIYSFEDSRGALWGSSRTRQIHRLQNGETTIFTEKEIPALKDLAPSVFTEDAEGGVWFALTDALSVKPSKIVRFKDGQLTVFDSGEALDYLRRILIDREGNLWLTTNKGLRRWRRQLITALSEKDGLTSNEVYPLLATSNGDVYIGTIKGLNRYSDGKITSLDLKQANGFPIHLRGLWEDGAGRIWVSHYEGFGRLENGELKTISTKPPVSGVTAFAADREGNVWAATGEGIFNTATIKKSRITQPPTACRTTKSLRFISTKTVIFGRELSMDYRNSKTTSFLVTMTRPTVRKDLFGRFTKTRTAHCGLELTATGWCVCGTASFLISASNTGFSTTAFLQF
jgi:ligand-binding sensor domain-containing protein